MYGVLKSSTNTGNDNELLFVFSTPLDIVSNQPAYRSDTMSLKTRVSSQNVQRWEIEAQIAETNDSPNVLVHSTEKGLSEIFHIRMPQVYRSAPVPENLTLTTTSVKQIGSRNIDIAGLNGNDISGQFINFAGNSKVYLVTSIGTNGANATITPPLLTAIAQNASIIYGNKTTMAARYDANTVLGIKYSDGILVNQGSMKFIEAL